MIDEKIWLGLNEDQKLEELERYLSRYRELSAPSRHNLENVEHGQIKNLKSELKKTIEQIIDLEYVK